MIGRHDDEVRIAHPNGAWTMSYPADRFGGPLELTLGGQSVLRQGAPYIDDLTAERSVPRRVRFHRRMGAAVAASEAYLPFGGEIQLAQSCRHAANHLRGSLDIGWPQGSLVRRHFGLGQIFLPGDWRHYTCMPPAQHLAEGASARRQAIPAWNERDIMIGHWHRPPLALIFERADGTAVEIGVGDDLWRWEQCLGYGPESGSYKILREQGGIRLVREPLMCCSEFEPAPRSYRFTWYMAWRPAGWNAASACGTTYPLPWAPDENTGRDGLRSEWRASLAAALAAGQRLRWDIGAATWPRAWQRTGSGVAVDASAERSGEPCWHCPGVQRAVRRVVRQLRAWFPEGALTIAGVSTGICRDAAHLERKNAGGLLHGDLCSLLDFAVWTRQTLGKGWDVVAQPDDDGRRRPAMADLFGNNGFELDDDGEDEVSGDDS